MTSSTPINNLETGPMRSQLPDSPVDVATLMRQIRLCRSTLGAILEELECREVGAESVGSVAECTIGVTAEIESLWEAIGKLK